jgi:hypothetical protein
MYRTPLIYQSSQGLCKTGFERNVRHKQTCIRRQFSIKLPQERKSLTVQGDFDKIVDTNRNKLCF